MSRILEDLNKSPHNRHLNTDGKADSMRSLVRPAGWSPHVCVVGAGVAGLRCADVLINAGITVTLYEAKSGIGGRIRQGSIMGKLVDLGPNWIHGTENNPILDVARRSRTVTQEWEERQTCFDSDGSQMSDAEATELSESVWGAIAKAFEYSDGHSASIPSSESLMDYFEREIPKRESDGKKVTKILKMAQMWGAFVGEPIERQSLKFFFLEECIEGGTVFVAGTYNDILKDIGSTAMQKADIHFNTEITSFGSFDGTNWGERTASIQTAAGVEMQYDEVVITAPLGWLKKHKATAFREPLPQRISQAIDSIGYGRLEKVYVTFPNAFWHSEGEHRDVIHFLSPDYVDHPADLSWNQQCISLAALTGDLSHPTLLFYVYGPCATYMVKLITGLPDDSRAYYTKLEAFLHPFYSRLPNYSSESIECKPLAFLATAWQNDKFAGNGSYTDYQVGLEEGDKDIEIMRRGLGEERGLWFAGEHTAPFIALGTTTGAYWAGEGVARRICGLYGLDTSKEVDGVIPDDLLTKDLRADKHDAPHINGIAL